MFLSLQHFLVFGLILTSNLSRPEDRVAAMLKALPPIHGEKYKCGDMVKVVNELRRLGKTKSLIALRQYLKSGKYEENESVLIICRLLFVNPKGWEAPRIGAPFPEVTKDGPRKFPLFPIALSDRVPFFLVIGYSLGGLPESATNCLELCESIELIKDDYPTTGHEKAADALIRSEAFRQLYWAEEIWLPKMEKMIKEQAKKSK